jgi:extracellular factor (EF) 3-hydroxypalmitic acid methyl ester biosynthesis protein
MHAFVAREMGVLFHEVAAFKNVVEALQHAVADRVAANGERQVLATAIERLMDTAVQLERDAAPDRDLLDTTRKAFRHLTADVFCRSRMIERALHKPRGYAGDHALLDIYYTGSRAPAGFDRLLDDWAHDAPASRAVVARKEYVKGWLAERVAHRSCAKVVDLACGPCRIERDLFDTGRVADAQLVVADNDPEALAYAKRVIGPYADHVTFVQENAIRIARAREVPPSLADASLVVSLGLFDYLPRVLAVNLLRALRGSSLPGAELLVGNFAKGNPTRPFMEWAADWVLIYRSDEEFLQLFLDAGFSPDELTCERETENGLVLMVTARVP